MIVLAHVAAVLAGSFSIMVGVDVIDAGVEGAIDGAAKWLGGIFIFVVLSLVSIPLGLGFRWVAERLFSNAFFGATIMGVALSMFLVPVLHPAMMPTISMQDRPSEILALHFVAGFIGGSVWWLVERPEERQSQT